MMMGGLGYTNVHLCIIPARCNLLLLYVFCSVFQWQPDAFYCLFPIRPITCDHRCFNNIAPWLFKNIKISGSHWMSLQARTLANRSNPCYPAPTVMFMQAIVALLTRQSTLRQTIFSQSHSMVYQGPGELQELKELLWRRSALCWFRFWCHFSWLGLAQCLLGCCWKWFRWEKKRMLIQVKKIRTRQGVVISKLTNILLMTVESSCFLLLHCIFMAVLGCFPRDHSTPDPGPCIIRHEREPGTDLGLQTLDCCEPLFITLMFENESSKRV